MRIILSSLFLFTFFLQSFNAQTKDIFGNNIPDKKETITKGVSSKHNRTDEKGLKQGYWEKRFSNGKSAYTVTFIDDKPVGTMTRYYFNGNKQVVIEYDENQYGVAELFGEDGKLTAKGFYNETNKDSLWSYFSPQRILYTTENYKNGLLNGVTTYYYKDGSVSQEVEWKENIKDGSWKKYHENGQVKLSSAHKDDKIEGEYIIYFPNGKPEIKGLFTNGLENGTWVVYSPDGKVAYEIEYKDGKTLNSDRFDEKQRKLFDEFEKNKGILKDPEQFKHDPDSYLRGR